MIIDGMYFNEDNIFSMKIFHHSNPINIGIFYTNEDNTLLLYNDFLYVANNGVVTNINNDVIDFIYENSKSNNLDKEIIGKTLREYTYRNIPHQYSRGYDENEKLRKIMDLYKLFISNIREKHELKISFKLEIHEFNINIVSSGGYIETLPILNIKQNINLSNLTSDNIKDIINFNPETTMEQLQKKYFKFNKRQLFN